MEEPKIEIPQDLIDAIHSLNEMQDQRWDQAAAWMYRLICRRESLHNIDRYADIVLEGVGFDSETAKEDYKNYLNYIFYNFRDKYPDYLEMFKSEQEAPDDDDDNE